MPRLINYIGQNRQCLFQRRKSRFIEPNQTFAEVCLKLVCLHLLPIPLFFVKGIAIPIPIKGLQNFPLPNNITFTTDHKCVLREDTFGDFIIYGSLLAFFVPLSIMMITYLLTVQVLRKKVYLLKSKVTRRPSYPTITAVFQREQTPPSAAEQLHMLENRPPRTEGKTYACERTHFPTGDDPSFRRMSTVGKKSMQTLSNEQRASKVLGIVFLLFVVMWCPFFITNVTSALCTSCDGEVIGRLMEIFVWVGYVSSGINPLVYTLFNKTFRQAFARYITCNYKNCTNHTREWQSRASVTEQNFARISLRTSVAENSKRLMRRGMKNSCQSPRRFQQGAAQFVSNGLALDTMLLTENEGGKREEDVSRV